MVLFIMNAYYFNIYGRLVLLEWMNENWQIKNELEGWYDDPSIVPITLFPFSYWGDPPPFFYLVPIHLGLSKNIQFKTCQGLNSIGMLA